MQPYDMPINELEKYKPELTRESDFDEFWAKTKGLLADVALKYDIKKYDYPIRTAKVFSLVFKGFNNANIDCWFSVPNGSGPFPGIVLFHGYNWAPEGNIHDVVNLSLHGYAVLHMMVRGQQGRSSDNIVTSHGNFVGFMTKGIMDKNEYYYRAVYMDAVRACEVLADIDIVKKDHIGVTGGSQGGALTLAAAALSEIPVVAAADMPYLSHFNRAIDIAPDHPYLEINEFFKRNSSPDIEKKALSTLSYFDIMNLAPRVKCPVIINQGIVDTIAPPSTVFAVYNHLSCEKHMVTWRYFGHEDIPLSVDNKLRMFLKYLSP